MITALLVPMFLFGTPPEAPVRAGHPAGGDDPAIQIWISDNRRFLPGDRAKVQVRAREDGYLVVFHADPDGHLRVLFPIDPNDDSFVRGGKKYEVRGRSGRESFTADNGKGRGTVYAALSHDPFRFDQFVLGDHWDYRQLGPQRLPADPEQELNDLVRRMVDGSFDYDILTYDVLERVVYASDYGSSAYDYSYGCGYSAYGCGRSYYGSPYSLSVGLFFGRPSYRYNYYDPYRYAAYDPFYDPFFYDPYYYRPYSYRPVYLAPVRGYGYPYYNYPYAGYYTNGHRGWDRPYTPYRFRPADGTNTGYRDRRYDLRRSVNTVYLPPSVRGREPDNARPLRRVTTEPTGFAAGTSTERRPAAGSSTDRRPAAGDATPRRTTERTADRSGSSRLSRPNIDARRAREPEASPSAGPGTRDAREQARDRRDLPTEVKPQARSGDGPRRAVERPEEARPGEARPSDRPEPSRAEPVRSDREPQAQPEPRRAEPSRSEPQPQARPSPPPADRGGSRGTYSPPSRSDGGSAPGGGGRGGAQRR
ncbi:MAG: DUF4384 domain-containing protein [Gemmatimonadales bacterium]